jgi:hypothetical protein
VYITFGDTPMRSRSRSDISGPAIVRVHIYMMMIDETRLLHIDKGVMFKLVGSICLWQLFFSLFVRSPIRKVEEVCGLQLYNE